MSKVTRRVWSNSELERLRTMYPDSTMAQLKAAFDATPRQILYKAGRIGLRKTAGYLSSLGRQLDGRKGQSTRFAAGIVPWNKGKPHPASGRSMETQFKPGGRPHKWNPVGHERLRDGYLERKLTDTGVTRRDYVPVHHLLWREAGREIPTGHALVFVNGDRTDIRLENLELVSRTELMRRNSVCNLPPELAYVVRLRGVLNRKIKARSNERGR